MSALALAWLAARWRLALEVSLCLAVLVAYGAGERAGVVSQRVLDRSEAAAALAVADAKYRQAEVTYERNVSDLRRTFAAADATANAKDAASGAALRSGAVRLRFPLAARCPEAAGARSAAARVDAATRGELAPEVAAALFAIAADGDAAIRQLTALQAWSRSAVTLCSPPAVPRQKSPLRLADF